jgi:hypothetical protein
MLLSLVAPAAMARQQFSIIWWRCGMLGSRLLIGLLAASAALSTATACSRPNEAAGEVLPATSIGLTVTNQNFLDMDVYAVSDGLATRLGTVTGNAKRNFVLHPSLAAAGDLRIVATPIGGNGRASTGNVNVSPGQTIDFRIGSILRNSTVSIR